MFFLSMIEDGPRGLNGPRQNRGEDVNEIDDGEDVYLYGVDWEAMDDDELMDHHHQHNPIHLDNPFSSTPTTFSEVICAPPDCPLSAESVAQLNVYLAQFLDLSSHDMVVRRSLWREALQACNQIL